mgnify:CR=1 FL=1
MMTVKQAIRQMQRITYELYYFDQWGFNLARSGLKKACLEHARKFEERGLWWRVVKVDRVILSEEELAGEMLP